VFTWAAVAGATGYTISLDTDPSFGSPDLQGTAAVTSFTWATFLPSDVYYWKVVPNVGTFGPVTPRTFAVVSSAVAAPVPVLPANASFTNNPTPTYTWTDSPIPNTVRNFDVQVSTSPTFPLATTTLLQTTNTNSVQQSPALASTPGTVYYWRVRARYETVGGFIVTTAYSAVKSFTLDTVAPSAPTLTLPALNAVSRTASPTFTWTASAGVAPTNGYTLEVASSSNFAQDFQTATLSTNTLNTLVSSLLAPLPQKRAYWRVRARDAAGNVSPDSATGQFDVFLGTSPVPAFVSPTTTIRFVFNTIKGHTGGYQILVDADGNFSAGAIFSTPKFPPATAVSDFIEMTLPTGAYLWKVIKNGQPATIDNVVTNFAIASLTVAPTLNLPVEGDNLISLADSLDGIQLSWNEPVGNSGLPLLGYQYQTATNSTFTTGLVEDLVFGATTVNINRANATYFWRVRALYSGFVFSPFSAASSFTVDTTPPAAPVITAPLFDVFVPTANPTITWRAVPTATRYELRIDGTLVTSPNFTATSFTVPIGSPLSQVAHPMELRAFDSAGNSSPVASRNVAPFLGTSPVLWSFIGDTTPTFTFNTIQGYTGGYRVHVYDASVNTPLPGTPNLFYSSDVIFPTSPTALAVNFTVPNADALPYGTYVWIPMKESESANVGYYLTTFAIVPNPTLPPPTILNVEGDNVVNSTENGNGIQIDWTDTPAMSGVDFGHYNVQVSTSPSFSPLLINQNTISVGVSEYTATIYGNGTYYVRVRPVYWPYYFLNTFSPTRTFIVDTIAPNAPNITAPLEGATLSTARPTITWGAVPTANKYEVRIDGNLVSPPTLATTTFMLPNTAAALTQGAHTVTVTAYDAAGNSEISLTRNFSVFIGTTPVANALSSGAGPNVNVTFAWAAVTGATSYALEIDDDSAFGSPIALSPETVTTLSRSLSLPFGTYYWRVKPSTEGALTVAGRKLIVSNVPPVPPIAIQPFAPDGIIGTNEVASASVSWTTIPAPPHVSSVSYEVQVAPTAAFVPAQTTTFTTSTTNQSLSTITGDGLKHVRVRAVYTLPSSDKVFGLYTVVRTYTLDTTAPLPTTLTAPIANAIVTTRTPVFLWSAVPTATRYVIEIDDDNTFATPNITLKSTATTVTVPNGLALTNGTYYWRVTAFDAAGNAGTPTTGRKIVVNVP
jgi:hypothetical protein